MSIDRHRGVDLETDRRSVLKATGVAAGAGVLGLELEPVHADPDAEHFLIASDAHLGSPYANVEDFVTFLTEEVPSVDPDVLVLNGDVFELWFRGMSSLFLEYSGVSRHLEELHESGTEVVLTAGNHDRRLVTIGVDAWDGLAPAAPWEIANEFYFESGGTEFVALHGDDGDPLQQDPISEWLCTGTDAFGATILELHEWISGLDLGTTVGETGTVAVGADGSDWQTVSLERSYEEPVVVTSPASATDETPAQPRVKNELGWWFAGDVEDFEVRIERWNGGDGGSSGDDGDEHPEETVHYAVLESGRHRLGESTTVEVARVEADGDWTTVTFDAPFDAAPVVLCDVQTDNTDSWFTPTTDPVQARIRDVSAEGFEVRLEETGGGDPPAQTVGVVAVDPGTDAAGTGTLAAGLESAGATWDRIRFAQRMGDGPRLFGSLQTGDGEDASFLRYRELNRHGVDLTVQADGGASPAEGNLGYVALDGFDEIEATESSLVDEGDVEERIQEEWEDALQAGDGEIAVDDAPEEPPLMAGAEPQFFGHDYVRNALLDEYDEFVVFGHTHVPDLGGRYVNSGAWTSRGGDDGLPRNTYVEIVDGTITVWDWSEDGRDALFQS